MNPLAFSRGFKTEGRGRRRERGREGWREGREREGREGWKRKERKREDASKKKVSSVRDKQR